MDISKITDYLYVSASPEAESIDELGARNVRLIISMIGRRPPAEILAQPPYRLLWLPTFDSILTPIPISKLMEGVRAALPVIQDGGSILVYCAKGRHRSVAMAAAILIAMGYSARGAIGLLRTKRKRADPKAWHIQQRIRLFENCWRNELNRPNGVLSRICEAYAEFVTSLVSRIFLGRMRLGHRNIKNLNMELHDET